MARVKFECELDEHVVETLNETIEKLQTMGEKVDLTMFVTGAIKLQMRQILLMLQLRDIMSKEGPAFFADSEAIKSEESTLADKRKMH